MKNMCFKVWNFFYDHHCSEDICAPKLYFTSIRSKSQKSVCPGNSLTFTSLQKPQLQNMFVKEPPPSLFDETKSKFFPISDAYQGSSSFETFNNDEKLTGTGDLVKISPLLSSSLLPCIIMIIVTTIIVIITND